MSKTIREIRESSGLTQAAFSQKYGIPTRTIQNWEAGVSKCPEYFIALLARAVDEDNHVATLKTYDPGILKELGAIYRELLPILNGRGHNPYPEAEIFPVKYFTMVYLSAVRLHIPEDLDERIRRLMDSIDPQDWADSMDVPCPMDKRQYFSMALLGY